MWKTILHRSLVPILFVSVAGCAALLFTIKENNKSIAHKEAVRAAERAAAIEAERIKAEEEAKKAKAEEEARKRLLNIKISSHDAVFKSVGKEHNIDWRLLAALAKTESGFRSDAVSRSGAVGIMQIMPAVGKSLGYSRSQLFDIRTSVDLAAKVLHKNRDMLRLPEGIDKTEELSFILACYNAGYGRVSDARSLARHLGLNANAWSDVSSCLKKLSDPQYAKLKVVKLGIFRGSKETVGHVSKVLSIYNQYCNGNTSNM